MDGRQAGENLIIGFPYRIQFKEIDIILLCHQVHRPDSQNKSDIPLDRTGSQGWEKSNQR